MSRNFQNILISPPLIRSLTVLFVLASLLPVILVSNCVGSLPGVPFVVLDHSQVKKKNVNIEQWSISFSFLTEQVMKTKFYYYSLESINRIDCNVGGVGIYISNVVEYKVRTDLNSQNEIFESWFIEINKSNDKNIIIGSIYRHHHHSINEFNNYLEDIIKKISSENKLIYLTGDFNIDILKNNEKYIDDFFDLIYSYSLYPLILRPTRITDKSETLIDNILTNDLNNIGGILMFDIIDHLPNFTMTKKKIKLNKDDNHRMIRDLSNTNINNLKTCMNDFNWKDSLEIYGDVNSAYNEFTKTFTNMLNKFTPLKKKTTKAKTKSYLPWLTRDLIKMINKKTRLYKQYTRKRTTLNKTKYKTLNNKLNKLLRSAKRNYYSNELEKEKKNIKNTWKILNNVLDKDHKKPCNTEFNLNGQIINNPNQIPEHFNDFFINIGPNQVSQIADSNTHFSTYFSKSTDNTMFFNPITEDEVLEVI